MYPHQQVLCVHVYVRRPGTAEAVVLLSRSHRKKLAEGRPNYPLPCRLPGARCRVELSIFQGGNSSKDGATLTLTASKEKGRSWGCVCSLQSQDLVL